MKSLLFTLLFALLLSVTAIGITVPDRQTPYIENLQLMDVVVIGSPAIVGPVLFYPSQEFTTNQKSLGIKSLTNPRFDLDDGNMKQTTFTNHKPYRMPEYNYGRYVKPPLISAYLSYLS